ncbi:hypothetical protein IFM47457_08490 [Aspergillus lentulus]|nr:hypothetical protein IFM47457_08490 [Aspergillus lentulus]
MGESLSPCLRVGIFVEADFNFHLESVPTAQGPSALDSLVFGHSDSSVAYRTQPNQLLGARCEEQFYEFHCPWSF